MSEWKSVRLEELASPVKSAMATGPFGSAVSSKNFRTQGIPMLRGSNLSDDVGKRLIESELVYLDPELARTFERSVAATGDLIFTCWGSVGQIGFLDGRSHHDRYIVSNKQMKLTPNKSKVEPLFLYYYLSQPKMLDLVKGQAIGSTIPGFNLGQLRALSVRLPARAEQLAIAEVLGALDDKIAANVKLANGSTLLAKGFFNLTCARENVAWLPLGSIATTVLGGTPSRDVAGYWTGGTVAWLNSGKANEERITQPSEYITEEALLSSAAKLMPVGATLIAITGATLGQVARLEIEAAGNQSLIGIWAKDARLNDWLQFAVRTQIPELLTRATGAAQQHVNKRDVDALEVPLVDEECLTKFGASVGPLLKVAVFCDRQNITLATIRDALLPQFMSGKLRVRNAEKVLEGLL